MSKNHINIILFIIGTILILISFYFISFSIPSLDNSIESIDSNISKLDGKISEIQKVIEENREIENMMRSQTLRRHTQPQQSCGACRAVASGMHVLTQLCILICTLVKSCYSVCPNRSRAAGYSD